MQKESTFYSLQLRPIQLCSESSHGVSEVEVVAHPTGPGREMKGRFQQWEPIFERICSIMSSSPFHRKAMHRTIRAGLPTHFIDRATGSKHLFSREQIAELSLSSEEASINSAA